MVQNKKPKNIFEAAGSGSPDAGSSKPGKKAEGKSEPKSKLASFDEIFSRCKAMHEEIADTVDKNLEKSKFTPSKLRAYTSQPQNFSQQDWKMIEKQKTKNEEMLKELSQKVSRGVVEKKPTKPGKGKKKGKKGKVMTKRRWLKMR